MSHFGGSQRMETQAASRSTAAITHAKTGSPSSDNSSAPDLTLSSAPIGATQSLFGELRSTEQTDKKASNARSLGTRGNSRRQPLSDRLTPLLMFAGLVRGTTPLSIRRQLGAGIQDGALFGPDGNGAAKPKTG